MILKHHISMALFLAICLNFACDDDTDSSSTGTQGGTPAGTQGGTPAGTQGGTPAGSQGGTPAGSQGGTPAGSCEPEVVATDLSNPSESGALIEATFDSKVGVLLDEIPEVYRQAVIDDLMSKDADFWQKRIVQQIDTASYRLLFRNFYYEGLGQLPLPPYGAWKITQGTLTRETIDGHDVLVMPYRFKSVLISSKDEPKKADPLLDVIDGVVTEDFVLPVDPEHIFERTNYACMNEDDFPPNSVDTENARFFYDDLCDATRCHLTEMPMESCRDSVRANIGGVDVSIQFKRIAWDDALYNEYKIGEQSQNGPQVKASQEGMMDYRIVYRYFPEDSCSISEGCVGGSGWRRLLQFTATVINLGNQDMFLGDVGEGSLAVNNQLVSFSECHQHMHFNHYGSFAFGSSRDMSLGSKRAFCLESTNRYFNNIDTPLTHPYTCAYQGTAAGWGDDYIAGLDCQWVDVTTIVSDTPVTAPLSFNYNPDDFLCEGQLIKDDQCQPTFIETDFVNEQGINEKRFACEFTPDYKADNLANVDVTLPPQGGLLDHECSRYSIGEKRNCGFKALSNNALTCTAGQRVKVSCTGASADQPAILRLCEASHQLGVIPCLYREQLASNLLKGDALDFEIDCPASRSELESGGLIGIYVGTLNAKDTLGFDLNSINCQAMPVN